MLICIINYIINNFPCIETCISSVFWNAAKSHHSQMMIRWKVQTQSFHMQLLELWSVQVYYEWELYNLFDLKVVHLSCLLRENNEIWHTCLNSLTHSKTHPKTLKVSLMCTLELTLGWIWISFNFRELLTFFVSANEIWVFVHHCLNMI